MRNSAFILFFCCIGLFLGTLNNTYAQQNIMCNGVAYSFDNGNIYKINEETERLKIGLNAKSIECDKKNRLLAHMPDGITLVYDGRPNFWSKLEEAPNDPCDAPSGTYYTNSAKDHLKIGDRINTGKVLSSQSEKYFVLMTKDGRLTINKVTEKIACKDGKSIYKKYKKIWTVPTDKGTAGPGGYVVFQKNGQLCVHNKAGENVWCAPLFKGSVKVDINESTGCLQIWNKTNITWSSCEK